MVWKNQGLVDSTSNNFGDDREAIGPVNKLVPMQGGGKAGSNTPELWDRAKGLFRPTTKYRSVKPGSGTIGGANDGVIDKFKGFFANRGGSVESGGAGGGGGTTSSTYAQYFGVAAIGLAVGDLAGSIYNKRKSKRKR